MQHQVELHHRVVPNAATVEPPGAHWPFNDGLGYVAGHGGQPAYVPTASHLFHSAKPFQKAFPIRASQSGSTTIQRPPAMLSGIVSSTQEQSEHKLRRKTPNGTVDAGYDGSAAQLIPGQPPFKQVILPQAPWQASGQDPESSTHPTGLGNLQSVIPDTSFSPRNTAPSAYPRIFPTGSVADTANIHTGPGYNHGENRDGFCRILERFGPTPSAYQLPQTLHTPGYYPLLARSPQESVQHPLASRFNDDLSVSRGAAYGLTPGDVPGAPSVQSRQNGFHQPIPSLGQNPNFQGPSQPIQHSAYLNPTGMPSASKPTSMQNLSFQQKALAQAHNVYLRLITQRYMRKAHSKPGSGSGGSLRTFINLKLPRQFPSHSELPVESQSCPPLPLGNGAMPGIQTPDHSGRFSTTFREPLNRPLGSRPHIPFFHEPGLRDGDMSAWDQSWESLASDARVLQKTLSHLCEQSDWKWMDGMLLGGCLSYSVDDYEGALEWFSRLVALDPRYFIPVNPRLS